MTFKIKYPLQADYYKELIGIISWMSYIGYPWLEIAQPVTFQIKKKTKKILELLYTEPQKKRHI